MREQMRNCVEEHQLQKTHILSITSALENLQRGRSDQDGDIRMATNKFDREMNNMKSTAHDVTIQLRDAIIAQKSTEDNLRANLEGVHTNMDDLYNNVEQHNIYSKIAQDVHNSEVTKGVHADPGLDDKHNVDPPGFHATTCRQNTHRQNPNGTNDDGTDRYTDNDSADNALTICNYTDAIFHHNKHGKPNDRSTDFCSNDSDCGIPQRYSSNATSRSCMDGRIWSRNNQRTGRCRNS